MIQSFTYMFLGNELQMMHSRWFDILKRDKGLILR